MYAIVQVGGRQYRAAAGQRLVVDRLDVEPGSRVHLADVRMLVAEEGDDTETEIGRPQVADVAVAARAISHFRGPKILVFKYKPKKRYRRHQGFRAELTELRIEEVRRGVYEDKPAPEVAKKRAPARAARASRAKAPATPPEPSGTAAKPAVASAQPAGPVRSRVAKRPTATHEGQGPAATASVKAAPAKVAAKKTPPPAAPAPRATTKTASSGDKPKATTTPRKPVVKTSTGEKKAPRTRAKPADKQEQADGS
jgi:large subunit ribosomal protein L21